ncbi:MAG: PAS domain S-box protein [Candidatus Thorarchaeota archaeon]|nr:PAS domain S-box protein [Candidatus Thorarchaeota archaeon]
MATDDTRAIRQELIKFSKAVESSPATVVITNLEGSIEYVNPKFTELTGYTFEEAFGENPRILKSGDTPEEVYADLWDTISSGGTWHGEFVNKKKNGEKYLEEAWIAPIADEDSRITHYVAVKLDISQRKKIVKALEESEKRNREWIENLPEGTAITDFSENIVFANRAFAEILGMEVEEIIGSNILDFVPHEEKDAILNQTANRKEGFTSSYALTMVRSDGKQIHVRVSAVPWRNEEGIIAGTIAVVIDETERIRVERQLVSTNRDLALYASILRHDIANDLQIILAQTQLASLALPEDSELRTYCSATQSASERMKNLLDMLGSQERETPQRLDDSLGSAVRLALQAHPGLEVKLQMSPEVIGIRTQGGRLLTIVWTNLLRNSVQHGNPTVEAVISARKHDKKISITFEDNGKGIPIELQGNLFAKGISDEGRGQGLYLCKRIIEAYGGTIEYCPRDTGAAFTMVLPIGNSAT